MLQEFYKKNNFQAPELHVVLGSGLSGSLDKLSLDSRWSLGPTLAFSDVPGISSATAPGHKGAFRYFHDKKSGKTLCFQVGRLHGYEGLDPRDAVKPITLACLAGTKKFILSNAAGALVSHFRPGSVMIISDHVNMTGKNPCQGPVDKNPTTQQPLGPRFTDMTQAWSKSLNQKLKENFIRSGLDVHEGVYLGLMGPTYETPAEVSLFARWGLHAVGMSTVWECIQLKHMGAEVYGFSLISNLGAGISGQPLNHNEVEEEGRKASQKIIAGIFAHAEKEWT